MHLTALRFVHSNCKLEITELFTVLRIRSILLYMCIVYIYV